MARTTINSLGIPNDTIVSADLDYPLTGFSSTGITDNATSTALTIDSSGNTSTTGDITANAFVGDGSQLTGLPPGYTNSDVDTHLNTSTATTDQILKWTGSDYSWVADGGGATEDAFYENSQTLNANVTISAGRNALATGPLTVASGFGVTIESGCRVVII
jgi:hypothetical protein